MIISVDFDNTINIGSYPSIGKPNERLIQYLINCRKCGIKVILNTMREGELLRNAVEFCKAHGLEFDAVNDNLPEMCEKYGNNPRKIFADIYVDNNNAIIAGFGKRLPDLKRYRKGKT